MATVRIDFRKSKIYKSGKSPIYLRITNVNKLHHKLIESVDKKHWNSKTKRVRSSHPNYKAINIKIETEYNKAKAYIINCDSNDLSYDFEYYLSGGGSDSLSDLLKAQGVKRNNSGSSRTAKKYYSLANIIDEYKSGTTIKMIDEHWLSGFDKFLRVNKNHKSSTRERYLRMIRPFKKDAFKNFSMPSKRVITQKQTEEEVRSLESAEGLTPAEQKAVHMWLFSYYNRGIRVHNLYTMKWTNIVDGRLEYWTQKKPSKFHSIKLSKKSFEILETYRGLNKNYIFGAIFKEENDSSEFLDHIDARNSYWRTNLKRAAEKVGIESRITMHTARHTFTSILDQKGVSVRDLQDLLGHQSRETTEIYLREIRRREDLDDATEGLL